MKLSTLLVIIVIAVVALILIMFPESRVLLKGFVRLFIKDRATTVEGAQAVFDQQIDELQEVRDKADEALRVASGKRSMEERKNKALKVRLKELEDACDALVKAGNIEAASTKSEERTDTLTEIKNSDLRLKAYVEGENAARESFNMAERNLKISKRKAKETIENMKTKQVMKEVYDQIDENRANSSTDKLVDAIMEKNQNLDEVVEGSRVVHNSKLSTRSAKADEAAQKAQGDAYLESLKKKYKSKGFAAGCSREVIEQGAQQLGWDLEKLLELTLQAMAECEDEIAAQMAR